MAEDYEDEARVLKAFCNEYRLQVLAQLRTGEKCACELLEEIDISQPNLSHHMKILCESGVVTSWQKGKWTHYAIDEKGARRAVELLGRLTAVDGLAAVVPSRC